MDETRTCKDCRSPILSGRSTDRCKACNSARTRAWRARNPEKSRRNVYNQSVRRRFGITADDYDAMYASQNGLCAICQLPEPSRNKDGTPRRLHIDHEHGTGLIRKLLCSKCNIGIGGFRDDPRLLAKAIRYISEHSVATKEGFVMGTMVYERRGGDIRPFVALPSDDRGKATETIGEIVHAQSLLRFPSAAKDRPARTLQ